MKKGGVVGDGVGTIEGCFTHRVSRARKNWTETPTKRKNESPERDFRDSLREIAILCGWALIEIPDVVPIKRDGFIPVSKKRPCDDILVTSHGNYMIEAKYGNNPLLPHQLATQSKVNAINGSYYVLRKKILKKGIIYSVEQNNKVLYKTCEIIGIFKFFANPQEYLSQEIMRQGLDNILPYNTKKLLRKVRV